MDSRVKPIHRLYSVHVQIDICHRLSLPVVLVLGSAYQNYLARIDWHSTESVRGLLIPHLSTIPIFLLRTYPRLRTLIDYEFPLHLITSVHPFLLL